MAGERPTDVEVLSAQDAPVPGGRLAIFDLDRTLLPGSSLVALGRAMATAGMLSRRRLASAAVQDARFRRRGSRGGEVERLRHEALAHIGGLARQPLVELAHEVAATLAPQISAGARLLLDRHVAAGDFVVVLSASPQELVEAIVGVLGAHRGIGTRAAHEAGTYTGRLDGPFCYGAGKIDRLLIDVGAVDLHQAAAYADSTSDLPLLLACGEPVAVNPDRGLRAVADRRGWPILRFQ